MAMDLLQPVLLNKSKTPQYLKLNGTRKVEHLLRNSTYISLLIHVCKMVGDNQSRRTEAGFQMLLSFQNFLIFSCKTSDMVQISVATVSAESAGWRGQLLSQAGTLYLLEINKQ